jgi:putative sterol carrier protein
MPELFGAAWAQAFKRAIDASDEYSRASKTWEWPVVLMSRADAKAGETVSPHVYLDLYRGSCREARVGSAIDLDRAAFIISATRDTWLKVMSGKLELLTAVMLRKVVIEKGDVSRMLGSVDAVRALVKAAQAASAGYS